MSIGPIEYGPGRASFRVELVSGVSWRSEVTCEVCPRPGPPCRHDRLIRVLIKRMYKDEQRAASDAEYIAELKEAVAV